MKKQISQLMLFCAAAILMTSTSCGADDSQTAETSETTTTTEATTTTTTTTSATTTTTTTTTELTTTTEATTTTSLPASTIGELVPAQTVGSEASPESYARTPEYDAFLHDTVFVGDSICSGLKVYHILPDDNCVAKGCVGARSIFDYTFDVRGNEFSLTYALVLLQPKYVVFSMGMNDINMTSAEQYCKNYEKILDTVQSVLPNSKLFVASITPISNSITFSTNDKIDNYNQTIKNYLEGLGKGYGYVNFAPILKDQNNGLKSEFCGGDGIHLPPLAYQAILYQTCKELVDTGIVSGISDDGIAYGQH